MLGGGATFATLALTLTLFLAPAAGAQTSPQPFAPYGGANPFRCELQYVGTGTDFPRPEADPFCVEFDKTNQNVTEFGLAEFIAQEPARVGAAAPKCFYFQRDHWTGSIAQGQEPETWHWDGSYFFDKARGVGGVHVANFRIAGAPMDATPYAPPEFQPYFAAGGGGGAMTTLESGPDPRCVARVDTPEEREQVYADEARLRRCIEPGGELKGRRVGRVMLKMRRDAVLRRLGPPRDHAHRVDRWCLEGKGELRLAYSKRGRTVMILTSGRGHSVRGVSRGDRIQRARRRLDLRPSPSFEKTGTRGILVRRQPQRRLWVGVLRKRVRYLLVAKPRDRLRETVFSALVSRVR
jgi:hypothetical protein